MALVLMACLLQAASALSVTGAFLEPRPAQSRRGMLLCHVFANDSCLPDKIQVVGVLAFLLTVNLVTLFLCACIREDKDEQINPLCPQLVVKDRELVLRMSTPDRSQDATSVEVHTLTGEKVCTALIEIQDPFHPAAAGIAGSVRLLNPEDELLASVIVRVETAAHQGMAIFRAGFEIFGFVDPAGDSKYAVSHHTGIPIINFVGDFDRFSEISGLNPAGLKVCAVIRKADEVFVRVAQYVDIGLVMCTLMATQVDKKLSVAPACSLNPYSARPVDDEKPETD